MHPREHVNPGGRMHPGDCMYPRDHMHTGDHRYFGDRMHPRDHVHPRDHMQPRDHANPGCRMHLGNCMHPGDHVHPGALTPAHRRGSMLTIIGTHLDSVYRAKIRFEANGVRTEATVSAGAGGHHPLALPCPPRSPRHRASPVPSIPPPTGVRGLAGTRAAAVPRPSLPLREQGGDGVGEPERAAGRRRRPLALPPPLLPPARGLRLGAGGRAPPPQAR